MKFQYKLYKILNKYIFPYISNSLFVIKIKWKIALLTIGTEFHEINLKKNKEKLSQYFDTKMPLQNELAILLNNSKNKTIKILDVGAGPVSKVGKVHNEKPIKLVAIDPLALKYKKILVKNNLRPPVLTKYGYGEKLSILYKNDNFDLIHARNCLDHTKNPMLIIFEMLKVVKRDHYIYLNHYQNEGINADYYGLHQWNFTLKDSNFFIKNKDESININVNEKLKNIATITTEIKEGRIIVKIKKETNEQKIKSYTNSTQI